MIKLEVQAITSDEIFQEWLKKADGKTLKKFFEKKKVDFRREHVSAVETVYSVSKFIVVYFQKKIPEAFVAGADGKVETVTADKLHKYKFYDFKGKKVDFDQWKGDTSVPFLASIRRVDCQKCHGSGTHNCDKCSGSGRVKCDKCDGSGKRSCSSCRGKGVVIIDLDVYDVNNKKTKTRLIALNENGKIVVKNSKGLTDDIVKNFPELRADEDCLSDDRLNKFMNLAKLKAAEIIIASDICIGVVCLGEKLNKTEYTKDDLDFLKTIYLSRKNLIMYVIPTAPIDPINSDILYGIVEQ